MNGPLSIGASMTGLPNGKKKHARGRKTSNKPGAQHLSNLQKAHGAGDFKAAKTHALNYAKEAHKHVASETPEEHEALTMADMMVQPPPTKSVTKPPPPMQTKPSMARLALSRRKK